jgi:septum formation protein
VTQLILASGSAVRARLLRDAGVVFDVVRPDVEESHLKEELRAEAHSFADVAAALAGAKALSVSRRHPDAIVLGADQILVCEGNAFDKARDIAEARAHLAQFSGREHQLVTAATLMRGTQRLWQDVVTVRLTMRPLSEDFIDGYFASEGDAVLDAVGCYHLEGRGAQLFTRIDGDYFSILGLPLLPLLDRLRALGVLRT